MSLQQKKSFIAGLVTVIGLADRANASFGNYFSTGPVASGNFIKQANTTLVLPDAPNPVQANFGFWPGMGMSNGDLIQGIATSYPGDNTGADCGVVGSNWCVVATVLIHNNGYQTDGTAVTAYPGDHVTYSYLYNPSTTAYDQTVYVNGVAVSTLSSSAGGVAQGWGTAEECDSSTPCGVIPQQEWLNTVLLLNEADPNFGSTAAKNGASGDISTPDGGVTWEVPQIVINEYDFS